MQGEKQYLVFEGYEMHLSYSEVIAIVTDLNRIDPSKEPAFKARLRHFQRLEFPEGANTGKGKPAQYSIDMLFQMVLGIEFLQSGMTPSRSVSIIQKNWPEIRAQIAISATPEEYKDRLVPPLEDNNILMLVSPEALRELSKDGEDDLDYHEAVDFVPLSEVTGFLTGIENSPLVGSFFRWTMFMLQPLFHLTGHYLMQVRPDLGYEDIYQNLWDEVKQHNADILASLTLLNEGSPK